MVVLTIVTRNNGETVFLDQAIPQVQFMKLISCSLYNSWDTLKKEGIATLVNQGKVTKIPPGHYTPEGIKKLINGLFSRHGYTQLEAQINTPEGVIQINNFGAKAITFTREFANILGFDSELELITNVKRLNPSAYFIHCDLIDRNFNFFNNKKSDLLAKIDVKGKAYEKVRYDASCQQPIRDCSTDSHVNSIRISVRDENGELFDFKGMPLEFELELN